MKQKLERNIAMTFRVTEKERDMIRLAQKESGIINMRAYLVKMAANGLIIRIDLDHVREMNRLLGNIANNINQVAKRANQTGNVFTADIEEIKTRQDEIWVQQRAILISLAEILDALQKKIPKNVASALKHNLSPSQ
jgi:hypothetical protein